MFSTSLTSFFSRFYFILAYFKHILSIFYAFLCNSNALLITILEENVLSQVDWVKRAGLQPRPQVRMASEAVPKSRGVQKAKVVPRGAKSLKALSVLSESGAAKEKGFFFICFSSSFSGFHQISSDLKLKCRRLVRATFRGACAPR